MKTILAAAVLVLATTTQGFTMDSLSNYGWKNRVLVLFGSSTDEKMVQQVNLLQKQTDELADRDMVVLQVSRDAVRSIYGSAGNVEATRLKREAKVEGDGFEAVLVGKDGGIKLRSDKVVSDVEMFDLIDPHADAQSRPELTAGIDKIGRNESRRFRLDPCLNNRRKQQWIIPTTFA